jgi:hypothetical protein
VTVLGRSIARRTLAVAGLLAGGSVVLVVVLAVALGVLPGGGTGGPVAVASPSPSPNPSPRPSPTPSPSPSPSPTPSPPYEHLSGIVTTPELAGRYPIAVMLDDSPAARPQAGLSDASLVWQAPVEGGIPRYMAVFQSGTPPSIGPIRSARLYFAQWAAEWRAVYLHAGGPPPLKTFLASSSSPVIDVNGRATRRVDWRRAPHNLYTTGERLRTFAEIQLGATPDALAYDPSDPGALQPFRDPASAVDRGRDGGTIRVTYTSERIDYRYDRASNTWFRSVGGKEQRDALDAPNAGGGATATGPAIAPTTVIMMVVSIKKSASIEEALGRLVAASIGEGPAWVFADGRVTEATWRKPAVSERTRFVKAAGEEIALPRGQIFIQVVPDRDAFTFAVDPS